MQTRIVILCTSDVHGHMLSDPSGRIMGMAGASAVIKEFRRQEKNVIVIDNGDLIQGTPLAQWAISEYEDSGIPNPIISVHNQLCYDAAVLGNHEFNFGIEKLSYIVSESNFPWISANVVRKGTKQPLFGQPYIIREFEGIRIGILGLTTKFVPVWEDPRHIEGVDFLDPIETARHWVPLLKQEEKADIIILAYHGGLERNPETLEPIGQDHGENQGYRLAKEVNGIDAVITGHQHMLLASKIDDIAVVQPGTGASHVGKITFIVSKTEKGTTCNIEKQVELISTEGIQPDDQIGTILQTAVTCSEQWLNKKFGETRGDFTIKDPLNEVWLKEHPIIEWINRVQMNAAETEISCTALLNPDIKGLGRTISRRDILEVYPFPNTLVVLKLTGIDIKLALEQTASFFTVKNGEVGIHSDWTKPRLLSFNYDMWEGIEYIIDITRPPGERVINLRCSGKDIENNKYYHVAMNNYRSSGAGGYHMFGPDKIVKEIPIEISELLIRDVSENKILHAEVNHNWQVKKGST